MRKLIVAFLALPVLVFGQPPAGYYDSAAGLSGPELRNALRDIIDGHTVLSYSILWNYFAQTDRRPAPDNNKVWDMYSDIPTGTPPYIYTFVTNQCGNYNSEGDCFNREHSFPKSWFNDLPPMDSDLHHLYPTDGFVNNKRGDFPYGKVGSADWTGQNGSKTGQSISQGYNGTVFEPIDAYKGDFARAYFYMLTRYWGQTTAWNSPMLQSGDFNLWAQTALLLWHTNDPVSSKEIDRNNVVFQFQHNRNPFIDNPQWAYSIWGPVASVGENNDPVARIWTSNGTLTVELGTMASGSTIQLMDITGRTIATVQIKDLRTVVDLSLVSGTYVAVVESNGRRAVQRFTL